MAGWGVTAAIVVLLTQAQIEMTMFNSATAVFVLALLGAAAPWRAGVGRTVPAQLAAIVAIMCVVVVSRGALPWTAQDRAVTAAAQILIDAPESADARDLAGHALAEAWSAQRDPRLLVHAADQYLSAAATPGREQGLVLISLSLASGEGGWAYKQGLLAGGRRKLEALDGLAVVTGNPKHFAAVLVLARELANRDPGSAEAWVTLARSCQRAGLYAEAAEAWSRAIDVDDANVIDPMQRLPEAVRREATDAIAVPAPR
jgi:tetratricopeptide (TPR) repeat protein